MLCISNLRAARCLMLVLFFALAATACAPSVTVRTDSDPSVNLASYETFGFFKQMGIEGDNYSSLLGEHFRQVISSEMEARGYAPSDDPGLRINVSVGAEEKVRVNTYQEPYLYGGFYGARTYGYWGSPFYGGATQTTVRQYTEANVYIDLVDTSQDKMVWQGVASFTLTDKMQTQMRATIERTVEGIFSRFPVPVSEPAG